MFIWSHFFQLFPPNFQTISGSYDIKLVILSYIIAVFASYVALDFSGLLRKETRPFKKYFWLIGGAFSMGAGIWTMHFIGMLAFIMPMPMNYDLFKTALSLFVAILSAVFALFLIRDIKSSTTLPILVGGMIIGLGIASMHYIGMSAMIGVVIHYWPFRFILSILIGIFASEAALYLIVKSNQGSYTQQTRAKIVSAFIMGAAICGMHYTGISAAVFQMGPMQNIAMNNIMTDKGLTFFIASTTGIILIISLMVSTHQQRLSNAIQIEKDFLNAMLDNLSDGVIACNKKGDITVINRPLQKYAFSEQEILKKNKNPTTKKLYALLMRALSGEKIISEPIKINIQKETKYLIVKGQPILNTHFEKKGAVITLHDITKRKKLENELAYQATHDALTGLPNRILLLDRIEQAISQEKRQKIMLAILFIDLDFFKNINDKLGHDIGDKLLLCISNRLQNTVRETDTVARLGGDEFVVVLNHLENTEMISSIAHKINIALTKPFLFKEKTIRSSASIGISVFPNNGLTPEQLLKNADAAMYRSKKNGRNNFCFFDEKMNLHAKKVMDIENDLKHALKNKEFLLHFQPVFDAKYDHVTSVEALLRWQPPHKKIIFPLEFLPLAEEMGIMNEIGNFVIETACEQLQKWQKLGISHLNMAINISPKQLYEKNFINTLKKILKKTEVPPQNIELEITENMTINQSELLIKRLKAIKKLGCQITLNDFGTIYSNFINLGDLPIHKVKLNRSLLHTHDKKEPLKSMMMGIISIASSMKMKVTAEGAETKKDLAFLRFNPCNEVQGFYFCEPLNAKDCTEFLLKKMKKKY